jgi:hypothetical protein
MKRLFTALISPLLAASPPRKTSVETLREQ